MLMVINECFGGFELSEKAVKALGYENEWEAESISRSDPILVKMVLEDPEGTSGSAASLGVVEIPDNATDWCMWEYDGSESVIYVLDGKICHAHEVEQEEVKKDER